MKVQVLGCHGGVAPEYQTTCYYINDSFLLDAGSICSALTPAKQSNINDIVITHPHLDHIKDICFLLENTYSNDRAPLKIYSIANILKNIQDHLLNDIIWPDFAKITIGDKEPYPMVEYIEIKDSIEINGTKLTPFNVNHPGNAVGYLMDDGKTQVLFTGDSGPCEKIWEIANGCQNLKAIYTEITFPNRMDALAKASGHFTLEQLLGELAQLKNKKIPIYIAHFKPLFLDELLNEFDSLAPDQLELLHENDVYEFS